MLGSCKPLERISRLVLKEDSTTQTMGRHEDAERHKEIGKNAGSLLLGA